MKSTNYGLIFKLFLWILPWAMSAQTDSLRVMSYNLLMYPSGTTYSREPYLREITASYGPDLLAVCELETEQAADDILNRVLRPHSPGFERAAFEPNHSDPNSTLHQMLFYNGDKLALHRQTYISTGIRDINRYTLYLKTPSLTAGDTIFLTVYVLHLKASQGTYNEDTRLQMIRALTADLATLPPDRYVLVAGDFNLYSDREPAYAELTDTTNAIVLDDPAGREGYWHENRSFADVHTQSPNRNKGGNFVGGGLDDRFDFIFTSVNLLNSASSVRYRTGSYAAYGNNGNCFNGNINDPACSGYYSQTLRDNLYEMSDHLPVVLTLETPLTQAATASAEVPAFRLYPNPARDYIRLSDKDPASYRILSATGRVLMEGLPGGGENWYIGHLKPGIYYVQRENGGPAAAFIKL
ncbi:MAG: T9SS type A sorting domain-containing protein [Chlorobi bacterium]|nr:T9SS type A sorting domain-containing protein [Chlorobiota bacterium]